MKFAFHKPTFSLGFLAQLGLNALFWLGFLLVLGLGALAVREQVATLGQVRSESLLIVPSSARINFNGLNSTVEKIQEGSLYTPPQGPDSPFGLPSTPEK